MRSPRSHPPFAPLTDRENDILRLLAQGLSDREIAEATVLTVGTVKWYNRQIYSKLGTRNRTEATIRAEQLGLVKRSGVEATEVAYSAKPPHNLPAQMTSFVGREAELAQIKALLAEARLVTLTGPPGTGKTRLALELAITIYQQQYRDGVIWVSLAPVTDPRRVLNIIAQELDIRTEIDDEHLLAAMQDRLREKTLLLILDNFEHLLSAAPLVSQLLAAAPDVIILVTSREALRLYGEHEYAVSPLALPHNVHDSGPDELLAYEAVDLFMQRARAVSPDLRLDETNAESIAAICVHLDGLPLAIELAAARIRFHAPQNLLIRLASRLEALSDGPRDLPARQQTLRATLAWSYELLDDAEKRLFARLGIFANGCTYAAAQSVCGNGLGSNLIASLESLVAKSLITVQQPESSEARLMMLETIREFALEKLEESGELSVMQGRHARYFKALLSDAAQEYSGLSEPDWLARLEADHDNLRAVLQRSLRSGDSAQECLWLIANLARFWELKGHFSEARNWLDAVLALPGAAQPTPARADALFGIAENIYFQCDYAACQTLLEEALAIYQTLGDRQKIARTLISIGEVATEIGAYDRAPALFEQAYAIVHALDDRLGNARALTQLGFGALRVGKMGQAQQWLVEGLDLYQAEEDVVGEALALSGLGEIALRNGELEQATNLLTESFRLRNAIGHRWGMAATLGSLAWVMLRQGNLRRAQETLMESLRIRTDIGDRGGIAWCLEKLAEIAQRRDDPGQAIRLLGAASGLRARINSAIDPADQAAHSVRIERLKAALPPDIFQALWVEGQDMADKGIDLIANYIPDI